MHMLNEMMRTKVATKKEDGIRVKSKSRRLMMRVVRRKPRKQHKDTRRNKRKYYTGKEKKISSMRSHKQMMMLREMKH